MDGFRLLELPPELVVNTLEYLPHRDLAACSYTCRALRDAITQFPALLYSYELGVTGLEEISRNPLPKATKLATLRQYQSNWADLRHLRFDKRNLTRIPIHAGPAWELSGGVIAQSKGPDKIEFVQLPSKTRGVPHETWIVDMPKGVRKRDFTIDPGQDLVVVVQDSSTEDVPNGRCLLHLLTMRTGEAHPFAKDPILNVCNIPPGPHMFEIRIYKNYLGVLVSPAMEEVEDPPSWSYFSIRDWKTGNELYAQRTSACSSFTFLSENYAAILHLLEPYSDPHDVGFVTKSALTVVKIPTPEEKPPRGPQCWMLELPICQTRSCMIQDLEILCESPPAWTSGSSTGASTSSSSKASTSQRTSVPPFGISSSQRIAVLAMNIVDFSDMEEDGPRLHSLQFVILISGLLREMSDSLDMYKAGKFKDGIKLDPAFETPGFEPNARFLPGNETRVPDIRYEWRAWGEERTRVLSLHRGWQSAWPCITYGTRLVFNDPTHGIVVYDFNPFAVRKALYEHGLPFSREFAIHEDEYNQSWGVINGQRELLEEPFNASFCEDVRSSLPYVWHHTNIDRVQATRIILNTQEPAESDDDSDTDDDDDLITAAMLSEDSIILIHGWDPHTAYLAIEIDYW